MEDLGVDLHNRLERKEGEGSGWGILKINKIEIHFYKTGVCGTKKLGNYVPWPKNCPGRQHVVNIRTKTDNCVLFSLIAHFHLKEDTNISRKCKVLEWTYRKFKNTYFTFPSLPSNKPVTLEDFPLIEKSCNLNIRLYAITKEKEGYGHVNVYRGSLDASPERTVYLVQILEENHVALIP